MGGKKKRPPPLSLSLPMGPLLIGASVALTLSLWMGTKIARQDWFAYPALYGSKTCALTAVTLMGWLILLASRAPWIEQLFGGLDRAYRWHRKLGITVGILLILHPLFLSEPRLPDLSWTLSFLVVPFPYPVDRYQVGANLGALLLAALVVLLFLARRLSRPYQSWLKRHRWMGAIFALSLVHIWLVDRDVASYPLLGAWLWSWLLANLGVWLWLRAYRWVGPQALYRVCHLESNDGLIRLQLEPVAQGLQFEPGQWVFVQADGVGEPGERHPLSLASAPRDDGRVALGVRVVGPWTSQLVRLQKGQVVRLFGPYGVLGHQFLRESTEVICIGGGIGITPFLGFWDAALHSEELLPGDQPQAPASLHAQDLRDWKSPSVQLFYLVKDEHDALFDPWIRQTAIASRFHGLAHAADRGHQYHLLISPAQAPVTLHDIDRMCGGLTGKKIFMCGPPRMLRSFREQAAILGLPQTAIFSELFEWRAGDES